MNDEKPHSADTVHLRGVQPEAERAQEIAPDDACVDLHTDAEDIAASAMGATAAATTAWRVARCLTQLRDQVNAMAPSRSKRSDGTIGDLAHQGRDSDHNPWVVGADGIGVVTALDLTNDPAGGCDMEQVVETIRGSRDRRIKYIIWNRRIASATPRGGEPAWAWRAYGGSNPHTRHAHFSVLPESLAFDDTAEWTIRAGSTLASIPLPLMAVAEEPLFAIEIPPVEAPVQRGGPLLTELGQADRLIRARTARQQFRVSGKGLVVAVLDTGLNAEHIDFTGRVLPGRNFTRDGAATDTTDRHGHGTNVAGIICAGADHVGIAPGAQVIPLKVLGDQGGGDFRWVREALDWVIEHHAEQRISVICLSLGDSRNHVSDTGFPRDSIQDRLRRLTASGVVCCVAAGNDYFTHGSRQGMGYPAIFRETVSVGAVYDANEGSFSYGAAVAHSTAADRITPFSQRLHESTGGAAATDIFAPGAPITSSGIGGRRAESIQHGTSQATPVICGVVLLLQELHMRAFGRLPAVPDVLQWMRSSAVKIIDGDDENDNVGHTNQTFRRVDALAALEAAASAATLAAFMAGRTRVL